MSFPIDPAAHSIEWIVFLPGAPLTTPAPRSIFDRPGILVLDRVEAGASRENVSAPGRDEPERKEIEAGPAQIDIVAARIAGDVVAWAQAVRVGAGSRSEGLVGAGTGHHDV
ncbi:MAG: hypothetical protein ACRDMY_02990 [Gaiellaceae bacterium]